MGGKVKNDISRFGFHFYFIEGHSIRLNVLNKCNNDFFHIVKRFSKFIDSEILIEIEAFEKGSFLQVLSFICEEEELIQIVIGFLVLILSKKIENKENILKNTDSTIQIETARMNHETARMNHETARMNHETARKYRHELSRQIDFYKLNGCVQGLNLIDEILEDSIIVNHKSNFYKTLHDDSHVTRFETLTIDEMNNREVVFSEIREKYQDYILPSITKSKNIHKNVEIEIISPVWRNKEILWKGFYNDELIEFKVNDSNFLNRIDNNQVHLFPGIKINCDMIQKTSETNISIMNVLSIKDENVTIFPGQIKNELDNTNKKNTKLNKKRKGVKRRGFSRVLKLSSFKDTKIVNTQKNLRSYKMIVIVITIIGLLIGVLASVNPTKKIEEWKHASNKPNRIEESKSLSRHQIDQIDQIKQIKSNTVNINDYFENDNFNLFNDDTYIYISVNDGNTFNNLYQFFSSANNPKHPIIRSLAGTYTDWDMFESNYERLNAEIKNDPQGIGFFDDDFILPGDIYKISRKF